MAFLWTYSNRSIYDKEEEVGHGFLVRNADVISKDKVEKILMRTKNKIRKDQGTNLKRKHLKIHKFLFFHCFSSHNMQNMAD